jgi:hypothetical protein
MSDFFQNLVARSRAPLDAVRPRTASMFEPAPPAIPVASDSDLIEEEDESIAAPTPKRRLRRDEFDIAAETEAAFEPAPRPVGAYDSPQPLALSPALHVPPMQAAAPAGPAVSRDSVMLEAAVVERTLQSESSARESAPMPHAPTAREIRQIFNQEPHHERETRVETQGQPAPFAANSATLQATLRERLIQPLVASPSGESPNPSETPAGAARAAEAEPVIHVSIGRIEVRAVNEGQRTRTEKQASAVMSLDEYLRSRERGAAR